LVADGFLPAATFSFFFGGMMGGGGVVGEVDPKVQGEVKSAFIEPLKS
jgi:hypothetical protein